MKNENENLTTEPATAGYLLLFRGKDWDEGLSPEELQEVTGRVMAWFDGLSRNGLVKGGQPLARKGRTVSGENGRFVADGPFAESKEAVGGYLLLQVNSLDEAVAIARRCPSLEYGISIEVRPILEECPVFHRVRERERQMGAVAA